MRYQTGSEFIERSVFTWVSTLVLSISIAAIPARMLGARVPDKTTSELQAVNTGPEAGETIPSFSLRDQNGNRQTFENLRGSKGLLLLVYRSADWCPWCKSQLVQLERKRKSFEQNSINVTALSYDSVEVLKHFSKRRGIGFTLLSDPDSVLIRKLGILNRLTPRRHAFFGVPYPGQHLISEKGVIKEKFFEQNYRDRFTTDLVMVRQLGSDLGARHTEIEMDHLKVSLWASDEVLVGGNRITLVLDINIKDGMHVYAPEVEGYIPIEWELEKVAGVSNYTTIYPQPEMLYLPVIEEIVPAYQDSVRLLTDIKIGQKKQLEHLLNDMGELIVRGRLRYQACDDKICYLPQEIPLKWIFTLDDLDHTRVPENLRRERLSSQ